MQKVVNDGRDLTKQIIRVHADQKWTMTLQQNWSVAKEKIRIHT